MSVERILREDERVFNGTVDPDSLESFFDSFRFAILAGSTLDEHTALPPLQLSAVRMLTPIYQETRMEFDGAQHIHRKRIRELRQDFASAIFTIDALQNVIELRRETKYTYRYTGPINRDTQKASIDDEQIEKKWLIAIGKVTVLGTDYIQDQVRGLVEPIKNRGYYFTTKARTYDHRH